MRMTNWAGCCAAGALLSACIATEPGFNTTAAKTQALLDRNGITNIVSLVGSVTPQGDVPTSGRASYNGYIAIQTLAQGADSPRLVTVNDVEGLGDLNVSVNFSQSGGTFTSEISNVFSREGAGYEGRISGAGVLSQFQPSPTAAESGVGLDGNMSGSLVGNGSLAGTYNDLGISGGFQGDRGNRVLITANGEMDPANGTANRDVTVLGLAED